jgi:RNA polymerase sigma-70 factor (ECF subfamily)
MQYANLTDTQLVSMYVNDDEKAFEELLTRHQRKVFSYIMMMVKDYDVANDIFQEAFFKIVRTLKSGKYNDEGKFLPWVMRISHNLIIDHFRMNKKMPKVSQYVGSEEDEYDIFSGMSNGDLNAEDQMAATQVKSDVKKLVSKLPEEQKQVVIMRHYMDMSFKEIADVTDVSINTALGRMRYALINMRKMIEDHQMTMTY